MSSESVQPEGSGPEEGGAGQGERAEEAGLYDLSSVPDDIRPHLEPHLKAIDANVTRKFQEYSDQLKGWEPYEELGLRDLDPEQIGGLLEFAQMAQDEEAFAEWWKETGEQLGLYEDEDDDDLYEDEDDILDLDRDSLQKLVAKAVTENLSPIYEQMQRSEQERAEAATHGEIVEKLDGLREEHGEDIDTDAILQLAFAYVDDDPDNAIDRGFEDYQRLVGAGESRLFEGKSEAAGTGAEPGGSASTSPETPNDFDQAKVQARARMKESTAI